jgi:hypothetical protein
MNRFVINAVEFFFLLQLEAQDQFKNPSGRNQKVFKEFPISIQYSVEPLDDISPVLSAGPSENIFLTAKNA